MAKDLALSTIIFLVQKGEVFLCEDHFVHHLSIHLSLPRFLKAVRDRTLCEGHLVCRLITYTHAFHLYIHVFMMITQTLASNTCFLDFSSFYFSSPEVSSNKLF